MNKPPVGLERWLDEHTETLRDSGSVRVMSYMMRDMPVYLVFYRRPTPLHPLIYLARRGRPLRSFRKGLLLAIQGVPVARPLSCLALTSGALVLQEGHYGGDYYSALWKTSPSEEEAAKMMRGAGESIAAAHVAGFSHGACEWRNLFWSEGECSLMDLDAARKQRLMPKYFKARDLARFTVSAEEAGASAEQLNLFLERYLFVTSEERDVVVARMQGHLKKIRWRRSQDYGIKPRPLI